MTYTIHSKALHKALQIVAPAVNARAVIPILSSVRFQAGKVLATDLQISIETTSGLPNDFNAVIPFDELRSIAGVLSEELTLTLAAGVLHIKAKAGKWKLSLPANPETWPNTGEPMPSMVEVPEGFTDALYSASRMIAPDAILPFLANVLIHTRAGLMRVGGANKAKMYEIGFPSQERGTALVPPGIVKALAGFQPTGFGITEKFLHLSDGVTTIAARLAEGTIPDFSRMVATEPPGITCNRDALLAAIAQATTLKRSMTNELLLTFGEGITLTYYSTDRLNDATVQCTGEVTTPGDILLNAGFLADVLGCMDCETAGFVYAGSGKSLHMVDPDNPEILAIVQPMMSPAQG